MSTLTDVLVDQIAAKCIKFYTDLPKTGKPVEKEWTVLSCVVKTVNEPSDIDVVALGTGSKCIGASKLSPAGDILNDSHAEVMARRGFLVYLYDQVQYALEDQNSIFTLVGGKFKLKEGIEFIFFSSQLPCGDASIIPKIGDEDHFGDILKTHKRKATEDICDSDAKVSKAVEDVHRTGAKCLPGSLLQDTKKPGSNYHLIGQVRTKPGRGDRTLSVSCSDKMARWVHVGIQGGLLDMVLFEPIFIKQFIFGAGVLFAKESLHRALIARNAEDGVDLSVVPEFYQSSISFPHVRKDNLRAAAGSIVWIRTRVPISEVAVLGKKLGATKKKKDCLTNALTVSKVNIYRRFKDVVNKHSDLKEQLIEKQDLESIPYNIMKRKSVKYLEKWLEVKETFFKTWTVKPDIWDFC